MNEDKALLCLERPATANYALLNTFLWLKAKCLHAAYPIGMPIFHRVHLREI